MTKIPLKARLSLAWQSSILTLRYAFRLPIDELRERNREQLDQQIVDALETHTRLLNNLNARLHWYETKAPALKREYKAFCAHQKKLAKAAEKASERPAAAEMAVQAESAG